MNNIQLKAYKYRIYPNFKQISFLDKTFGCVRFVWNKLVDNFNNYGSENFQSNLNEKTLKDNPEFYFLNETISYSLQQKRIDFDETKNQFFNKKRKVKLGRMKFKKKGISRESFRIPGQALNFNHCINFETNRLKIPKMSPIKIIIDRKFTGQLKSITISKNNINQYFVSVLVKEEIELKQNTGKSIGIDLGLTHLAILSDGRKINNPRWFRENQSKLKKEQQHLSRKQKGSNRYNKQKLKVAKIHQKIVSQRTWFLHNLSTWLISNYDHIIMEDLNIAGMKRSKLGKSISDASWSKLIGMISYKSKWYGKVFYQIDKWFPSSKSCSYCGNKVDLTLDIREWTCDGCGISHDRDVNAAKNILDRGFLDLYELKSEELPDYRRGEEVRPDLLGAFFDETSIKSVTL